jgi:glycosyltransferase involved in cell wall biosynthesis
VASAVGGVPELVGDTALLVPPSDADALAQALERLLGDRELRRRLGSEGRRRVIEQFSLDAFVEAHLKLYRDELAARGL